MYPINLSTLTLSKLFNLLFDLKITNGILCNILQIKGYLIFNASQLIV
ncbi:unnamed protein product [Arabidopsis halleri]